MNKKNGFTLVELLAVIVLLGIIATIAITSSINVSKKLKHEMYCQQVEYIANAAKQYGADIFDGLTTSGVTVKVADLVKKGYLKDNQVNLETDTTFSDVTVKVYKKNNRAYAHVNVDTSSCD